MPPWIGDPEAVGVAVAATLGLIVTIGTALLGAVAALYAVWRAKIKPLLTGTQEAAAHAAEQLTPNHGSTVRDAVRRTEDAVARLDQNTGRQLGALRDDLRQFTDQNDRTHSELFRRLRALETPYEDTRP